jgi:diacylglycerol kinase family enzyme
MDGLLDVEVFAGRRRQALTVMPRIVRGTHLRHRAVIVRRGSVVAVDVPGHWPVEADGEILGTGPVTIECVPGAVDFII